MTPDNCYQFFARLQTQCPTPTTELRYHSTFELLISVILSAQATDISVNKATEKLFKVANTPEMLYALGEEGLKPYIKTIGLFNTKARNIILACRQLIDLHQGKVPQQREQLEALAGVGRKTANVILNTAFGQATIAVDTHIFRLANRTGLAKGTTVLAVEQQLLKVVPDGFKLNAHHWLILHGRYVCLARRPQCANCIVNDLCEFEAKTCD